MAVTKTILKNTNQETIVKIAGTSGSATIDLQTDLVAATQVSAGVTAAELATVQDNYDGAYAVLEDMFSQRSGQTGYPWGLTVPVGWYTIDEIQRLAPGTIPNAGALTASAQTLKNSWLMLQEYLNDVAKVNIAGFQFTGLASSTIAIARNSVNVTTIAAEGHDSVEFTAGNGYAETTNNTHDIVVTIAGAEAQLYLTLRKVGGYNTKVEPATYGSYDNESAVGS